MNINAISEYLNATTAKSLTNRVNAALEKDGTPAQLLRGASQSITALYNKVSDETERAILEIFIEAFNAGAEIAKRGKETTKAEKAPRENWHDEDSEEAQEILAKKSAPKPRKTTQKATLKSMSAKELRELVEALLNA